MASGGCGCEPGWPSGGGQRRHRQRRRPVRGPRRRPSSTPSRADGARRRAAPSEPDRTWTPTRRCAPTTGPGPDVRRLVSAPRRLLARRRSTTWRGRWSSTAATLWLDALPLAGEIVELAAGTGWWSPLLAGKGELWCYDAVPETLDLARRRLVAHGLRAHLHERDAWAEPDRPVDALFCGFWLSHVPRARLADFLALCRALAQAGRHVRLHRLAGDPASGARGNAWDPATETSERRLDDGHVPDPEGLLRARRADAGPDRRRASSRRSVTATPRFFLLGHGREAEADPPAPSGSVAERDQPAGPGTRLADRARSACPSLRPGRLRPSASSWRLPTMSQACAIPAGDVISAPLELELMPTQPTSIAFGADVVRPAEAPRPRRRPCRRWQSCKRLAGIDPDIACDTAAVLDRGGERPRV